MPIRRAGVGLRCELLALTGTLEQALRVIIRQSLQVGQRKYRDARRRFGRAQAEPRHRAPRRGGIRRDVLHGFWDARRRRNRWCEVTGPRRWVNESRSSRSTGPGTVISVDGITDEGAIFVELDTAARVPSESGTDAETAYNQLERAGPYIPEELEPVD